MLQEPELPVRLIDLTVENFIVKVCIFDLFVFLRSLYGFFQLYQEFLSVRPAVRSVSCSEVLLNLVPVFAMEAQSFKEGLMLFVCPPTGLEFLATAVIIGFLTSLHGLLRWGRIIRWFFILFLRSL